MTPTEHPISHKVLLVDDDDGYRGWSGCSIDTDNGQLHEHDAEACSSLTSTTVASDVRTSDDGLCQV